MDSDLDIVVTRQVAAGGQYLQVYRIMVAVLLQTLSQQSIPQDRDIAQTLFVSAAKCGK